MEFEWDDAKSNDCFMHRGFDFAYAIRAFLDPNRIVGRDRRWGLRRGPLPVARLAIERRVFVLIYTMRGSAIRIISARKASRKEVREYERDARQD